MGSFTISGYIYGHPGNNCRLGNKLLHLKPVYMSTTSIFSPRVSHFVRHNIWPFGSKKPTRRTIRKETGEVFCLFLLCFGAALKNRKVLSEKN